MKKIISISIFLTSISLIAEPYIVSFNDIKPVLFQRFKSNPYTLYCGCKMDYSNGNGGKTIIKESCPYKGDDKVSWEHVVPAKRFGQNRVCWTKGNPACKKKGRECCRKTDPVFRQMEADPNNLYPVILKLNTMRKDYEYGEIPGEKREFGQCDFELDKIHKKAEPRKEARQTIAKVYFYMEKTYGIGLREDEKIMYNKWLKE